MCTPVPSDRPVEYCVFCVLCAPTCCTFWYMRSWNAAREALYPVVLLFERLFAITAIWVFCASSPVLAVHNARSMFEFLCVTKPTSRRGQHQTLGGLFVGIGRIDALDLKFVETLQLDHIDQGLRGIDVARLEHAR